MSTALVTGGSRGIGRAVCQKLAEKGFDIAFSYNSNDEQAKETIALCEAKGVKAVAFKYDVSNSSDCASLVEKTLETFGEIDVLVNNAGITRDSLIMRISDEDIEKVIDVNLKGTFYMMREVSKVMLKQRKGSIVNMSSVVGVVGNAGQVNYAASKAGVIGMTKSLAKELARRKIRVNAIAPGMIETDMTAKLSDAAKQKILGSIPFGEMGKPEDIANAVAFFASNESRYITGQVLIVDGGMV
ncbi:3-oxoacyl-[acyl-carrier-protein] reductase [Lachnospiraceae bacterium C7]|nr:3-oxoacyl-[acyl-carrier-protein] reductase [Lachnospiraceae bacterium C7]